MGRAAAAVAELQSAAAMLDPRFSSNHLTVYPIPQNSWIPLQDKRDAEVQKKESWERGGETAKKQTLKDNLWEPLKEAAVNFSLEGTTDSLLNPLVSHLPDDLIGEEDDRWTSDLLTPSKMVSLVTLLVDGCSVSLDLNVQVLKHLKEMWPSLDLRIAISKQIDFQYLYRVQQVKGVHIIRVSHVFFVVT